MSGNVAVKNGRGLPDNAWRLASGKGRGRLRPIGGAGGIAVALAEKPKPSQKEREEWRLLEENIMRENHSC